jgi:uncharacterized protein
MPSMIDFDTSPLTALEIRVLGVLVEKQFVTPDAYPLTVNAITAGCNQKTSRHPVMDVTERDVTATMDGLKARSMVIETYGASGRVLRYAHNIGKVLGIGPPMQALLASLMLRGPLTPGELRSACDRLYKFADISSVEAYLEDMIPRAVVPLVVKLPRQYGAREQRWAHLVGGPVAIDEEAAPVASDGGSRSDLRAEVAALRDEVAELRERLARLEVALGGDGSG